MDGECARMTSSASELLSLLLGGDSMLSLESMLSLAVVTWTCGIGEADKGKVGEMEEEIKGKQEEEVDVVTAAADSATPPGWDLPNG